MHYQKTYSQKILAHMSNGVVTIDKKEKIIIFNYRAEEILGRRASEMLGKDLRYLPSPLGDLLYEAMKTGATHQKREISLFQGKLPLEISTYPLVDEQQNPMGSVILFEDISSNFISSSSINLIGFNHFVGNHKLSPFINLTRVSVPFQRVSRTIPSPKIL